MSALDKKNNKKNMVTIKEFYNLYNKNSPYNKKRQFGPIDAKLFLRDLSLPVAYFCAKKDVSANLVTIIFLVVSLIGNALFIIPSIYTLIALVILHEVGQLLDCVDGQLARFHGVTSNFGENFDGLAHVLISGTFMLAFGLRLYSENGQAIFLILAGVGAFSKAFEHQLINAQETILDNSQIKKLYSGSKIRRYLVYGIESVASEVRIFAIIILALVSIQKIINVNLVEISFIIFVVYSLFENLIYKIYLTIKQLNFVEVKAWKGWQR